MGKTKKKVLTIVSTFFLLFQSFGPYIFFVSPVRAQSVPEKINSNISFSNEKNEFNVSINTKEEVEYVLSYQTDKQTEAISGKSEKSDDKDFERDFYAGTCSTDGNCVDHKVLRGILKTKVATQDFLNAKRFTIENKTFEIILDEEVDSLDFTDIEKKWLEEGTDISPPTPTAEPTKEPTTTPEGEILDGIYTSVTPTATPTPDLEEDQNQNNDEVLIATVLGNVDTSQFLLEDDSIAVDPSAKLFTDKSDYAPTEQVLITGTGFEADTDYDLTISSSDEPAVSNAVQVTTLNDGSFIYIYQLDGKYRPNYKVEAKDATGAIIASTTFTDSPPSFNGAVTGFVGAVGLVVSGSTTGDFNTMISGNLSGGVEGQWASFLGTVSGDITGNVIGGVNYNGVDTLSAEITNSGASGHVYLIGVFSGAAGHFDGQFITQSDPIDFTTAITIAGGNSVSVGSTLQLTATTNGESQEVAWSVWTGTDPSYGSATINQTTGLLTATGVGNVTVIASALDGSLVTQNHVITITPDITSPTIPSLVNPADGAYVKPAGLILDWSDVTDSEGSNPVTYKYKSSWTGGSYGPVSTGTTSQINASGSSDRVYSWQVQACDSAGNCSNWSGPWTVTVDSVAPTLAQVTPVSTPTNDATPNYTFSSNEIGTISYDGDCSSVTTAAIAGNNTITFNTLPDGTHSNCTITVSDAAGNASTPLNVSSFTIDTIAPDAPTPTSPIDGAVIQPIAFSQTWTAEIGAVQYRYQSCNVSPGDFGAVCSSVKFTSTYTGTTKNVGAGQPDSHFWWRVQAKDAVGNWSLYGEARELTIDGTAPTISAAVSAGTLGSNGWYTSNVTVSFTCLDVGSGIASCPADQILSTEGSSVSSTAQTTTDNAGNISNPSNIITVKIDKTNPTNAWVSPIHGSILSGLVNLQVNANDAKSGLNFVRFRYQPSGGTFVTIIEDTSTPYSTDWDTSAVSDGNYVLRARAQDNSGRINIKNINVTIDNTAPGAPTITAPTVGQYFSTTPITAHWSTVTDDSGIAKYQVGYVYDDHHTFSGSTCSDLPNGGCRDVAGNVTLRNHMPSTSEQGGVTIYVRGVDNAGNVGPWSAPVHYVYDATNPITAEISAPQNNETIKGTYTITANASDNVNGSGIDKVEFWHKNKFIVLCTDSDISDGLSCDWDTTTETDGAYTIYVTVFDKAGNFTSSSMIDVTVDNTAPIVTVDSLSTTDHTPQLTGTVDDDTATIDITVDGNPYTATNNNDGTWTLADDTITPALSDGTYDILASATDIVGNVGNDSTTDELEVTTPVVLGTTTTTSTGGTTTTASVCTDTKPGNAPVLTSAVGGANSVTLTWSQASDPVSYYLVAYGTSPGGQTYGNPNVGGQGTTSYTISGLSGGTTYYFKVRAGNGCEPGDYSNEISASPTGEFIEGPAAGFAEGVLGVATEEANIKEKEENKQEVLGTDTQDQKKQNNIKIWTSLLFLLFILLYIKNSLSNK